MDYYLTSLDDDVVNKYEFSPEKGLKVDKEVFVPKASHVRKVEQYIKKFKNKTSYEKYGSKAEYMDVKTVEKIIPNGNSSPKLEAINWGAWHIRIC